MKGCLSREIADELERFIAQKHATHYFFACGKLDSSQPVLQYGRDQTVFDLSSLTKAFVATPLVFDLVASGQMSLDTTLGDLNPPAALQKFSGITVASLLAHQSGLPAWRNFYVDEDQRAGNQHHRQRLYERLSRVAIEPARVGQDCYSDVGMILLGAVLEHRFERQLDQWFASILTKLAATTCDLQYRRNLAQHDYASSGFCHVRKRDIIGEVQDENCWALGGVTLHSGLFGSGPAVCEFLGCMWASLLGRRVLSENFAKVRPGNPSLLGFRQGNDENACVFGDGHAIGHWGFTGTAFWIDYQQANFVVLLTNRLVSGRFNPAIKYLRKSIFAKANEFLRSDHR